MVDSPYMEVQLYSAKLLFMLGADDDPTTVENVDAELRLPDGSRWSATFLSVSEVGRILRRWEVSGEGLGGIYMHCPDLIIVSRGGVETMTRVVEDILSSGDPGSALVRIDIEE